ncbi:DUF4345 domain-containing protein [Dyadobacter fermentans]|uniref:DUF4345 domain-containing protein n=1 Tax=Dyadobacter fermentans (strain ATCC 700827 / DSM 18053 / CIP 107007 / KCTC 52180 / NS114) TaxID=471854 RepID=C6VTI0_DYAFD|nr:DUF4345 domain-containing protein [Dyadobacter fermentans]ACT92923.1 conserved hypothetical protein [Dyadobacter fermentans DSM 18053]
MIKKRQNRKLLQIALGVCALVPIFTGLLGMAGNNNPLYYGTDQPAGLLLDSNLRFLNGLSVGIGVCTLSIIPDIKRRSAELRLICTVIFIGAVGRMLSIASYGFPPFPFDIIVFFEMALPPLFVFWQSKVAD